MLSKKILVNCALLTLLGGFSTLTWALDSMTESDAGYAPNSNEFVLGLAVTGGGDELAKVQLLYDDGDRDTQTIEAGGLVYFYAGIQSNEAPIPYRLTLGYFIDSVDAENGSVSFSRIPVEFMGLYNSGPHTLGAGLTYHLSPELDLGDIGLGSYQADDALGLVLMYEYTFEGNFALGLRYTDISYEFEGVEDVDGSNVGLLMELKF